MASSAPIVQRALRFLHAQTAPLARPRHDGIVALDRLVPWQHTGSVHGSIAPPGPQQVEAGTWIVVSDPGDLLPDFRGTVYGQVRVPEESGVDPAALTLHAGKVTDAFASLVQVPLERDGYFGIDLSSVERWRRGAWAFELRDPSGAVVGGRWPASDVLVGLSVELRVVGAVETVVGARRAPVDGVVAFDASAPGIKRLVLVDAEGVVLGATDATTGAVRSFAIRTPAGADDPLASLTFAYDQAIALQAALAAGDDGLAHRLLRGLLSLQVREGDQRGAFRLSGRQEAYEHDGPLLLRSGAHAIATAAVLAYVDAFPHRRDLVDDVLADALAWLRGRMVDGLVRGGVGLPTDDGIEASSLSWASTEHNIDAYFCFALASRVVDASWLATAAEIGDAMLRVLWSDASSRFYQGIDGTTLDDADPLDVHAWGAVLLATLGEHAKAARTIDDDALAPFRHATEVDGVAVQGFATAYADGGYPGMQPHVWWEGTCSVAYALARLGDRERADEVLRDAVGVQGADGGLPYASAAIPAYDIVAHESVASTAWSIFATLGRGIFEL